MDLAPRTEVHPSPRVSARYRAGEPTSLKANAGLYFRPPTALELFGDRGFIVGNPGLRAERGVSADAGVVVSPLRALGSVDRVYVELVGFGSRAVDAIVLVPNAGLVTGARNLGDTVIGGIELGASMRAFRSATLSANYTWLESRQVSTPVAAYEGKRLPQRPRHQAYARVDLARVYGSRLLSVWADATVTSGNFLDPANFDSVPARRFVGAGLKLEPVPGLLVGLEAKNIMNTRVERVELSPAPRPDVTTARRAVTDFFGYPLPGRAFYLTLDLEI